MVDGGLESLPLLPGASLACFIVCRGREEDEEEDGEDLYETTASPNYTHTPRHTERQMETQLDTRGRSIDSTGGAAGLYRCGEWWCGRMRVIGASGGTTGVVK